jgi:hypothetical protein
LIKETTKESFVNTAIVTCVELDENVYVGGVLVIDSDGFPLEFKHSNKITVTKVQKTLYGDSLLTYICQKLLKNKLINSIESDCSRFLTNLMELKDQRIDCADGEFDVELYVSRIEKAIRSVI